MIKTDKKIDRYKAIKSQEVKELAEDLNLNLSLAKEIEIWFANTEVKSSGNCRRREDLFQLFRKIAIDYYVGVAHTSVKDSVKPIEK
jgi:hypothetical protein